MDSWNLWKLFMDRLRIFIIIIIIIIIIIVIKYDDYYVVHGIVEDNL